MGKNQEGNGLSLEEAERHQIGGEGVGEEDQKSQGAVKMFVSEKRTWLAITGHEPDDTKVLPMEFALLSIIGTRKSAGISQPELINLSGQDKRSVPKRTDALQRKGYIEKRAIQIKAARTSLCTLRQFLTSENLSAESAAPGLETGAPKVIDFDVFTNRLFEILREHQIIARNDLKSALGFNDLWRWRILSRALRKFERIGVVKRVRAMSQYAKTMRKYHPCIMLVREPTEKDIEKFHDFSMHLYSETDQGEDAGFEEDAEAEDAADGPSSSEDVQKLGNEEEIEVSGRTLPLWSPDRIIHNQIFEAVDQTGTLGSSSLVSGLCIGKYSILTFQDLISSCCGVFWRRPLENTLARLSECWQLAQPLYLRHLALVRDTALQRTVTQYIHYSARNFSKVVEAGESSWGAVEFVSKGAKKNAVPVLPVDAKPQLDVYGLPLDSPRNELVNNGDCTLSDCMWVTKPRDYICSSSDPKPVKLDDGTYSKLNFLIQLPRLTSILLAIKYGIKGQPNSSSAAKTTPDTQVRLKLEDEGTSNIEMEAISTPAPRRQKRLKPPPVDLTGMSQKEILESMGMDKSWTDYSLLLLERPGPGVYVTPRGRRRPAGKERGRPPASRLAAFKSPRLREISWFMQEAEELDSGSPAPQPYATGHASQNTVTTAPVAVEPNINRSSVVRGTKRPYQRRASGQESAKAPKVPRTGDSGSRPEGTREPAVEVSVDRTGEAHSHQTQTPPRAKGKRKRAPSPETESQEGPRGRKSGRAGGPVVGDTHLRDLTDENEQWQRHGTFGEQQDRGPPQMAQASFNDIPKLPGADVQQSSRLPPNEASQVSGLAETPAVDNTGVGTQEDRIPRMEESKTVHHDLRDPSTPATTTKPAFTPISVTQTPVSRMSATPDTSAAKTSRSKLDQGGSVGFLRRKIVLDLVEKGGGAFPMGIELWYPFVTAWIKTKYKERPDMRTLRNAVKQLVDAGKLRQQTFCGKDKKGVMVTKTIICNSYLAPDDPIIENMQEQILAADGRHYFPPGVEVDPTISKHSSGPRLSRGSHPRSMLPVEPSVKVQLQQKPAVIQAMEKRKAETFQRRLNERSEMEKMRENMHEVRPSGVVRLLSLPRPEWNVSASNAPLPLGSEPMSGLFGPGRGKKHRLLAGGLGGGQLKRSRFAFSLMAPYAMLMSPAQSFNPLNGTFSTDAGLAQNIPTLTFSRGAQASRFKMSMLMNPYQSFNPGNGTFSTDAGVAAIGMRRSYLYRNSQKIDPHLPHSIDDQLIQAGRRNVRIPGETDSRSRNFIRDTNAILRWELQNQSLLQERSEDLRYINQGIHGSFESAPIEGGIHFDALPWEKDFSHVPVRRRRQRQGQRALQQIQPRSSQFVYMQPPGFPISLEDYQSQFPAQQPRRIERLNEMMAPGDDSGPSSQNKMFIRRNRYTSAFSNATYQKVMMAIVAVRALAGGADGRIVDWPLLSCCFPEHDPKMIQDKGKGILARNRLQIAKMQSDFQERFIDAYANNQVPPIDYGNLEGYDWGAVFEWANANLDLPRSDFIPDLPASREQFDDIFELREEPPSSLDEVYQNQGITLNRKKMLISSVPFATPLSSKQSEHRSQRQLELSRFETIKTWVRANVFTPDEVYRATDARSALAYVDNGQLSNALQSLVTERVISQANKGRILPGRNYDITDHFIQTLSKRRPIEVTEIRRACRFKTDILDKAFTEEGEEGEKEEKGTFSVPFGAEDGDILALLNLFREGRIRFIPQDPPRDKFGLTEGGYLTRLISKDKLRFPVGVRPVPGKYVYGNPVSERISHLPPPCPARIPVYNALLPERFPLWYDIHGNVIQVLWELSVAAVLGTVAVRPGIDAGRIADMIKPTMGAWEAEMVLEWLAGAGLVRSNGGDESSWYVLEWWWMVLS